MEELLGKSKFGLAKLSISYIFRETELFFFSLLSIFLSMAVGILFLSPFAIRAYQETPGEFGSLNFYNQFEDNFSEQLRAVEGIESLVYLFLTALVSSLIIFFFNAAIIESLNLHLNGEKSSFFKALGRALKNSKNIFLYSITNTIFSVIFRKVSESSGGLVSAIGLTFVGIGWYYANWFAMPILVTENKGPIESIKKSSALFKSKFSTQIISEFSLGIIFLPIYIVCFLPIVIFGLVGNIDSPDFKVQMIFVIVVSAIFAMITHVFSSAAEQILKLLVYRQATGEENVEE